jgi:hypothetical protein
VNQNGNSLQFGSEEQKNDKEIVKVALKENGDSLQFASRELRNDKNIVLKAARQKSSSIRFASPRLKNNKEFVWIAKNYFKLIRKINLYNVKFFFSND